MHTYLYIFLDTIVGTFKRIEYIRKIRLRHDMQNLRPIAETCYID